MDSKEVARRFDELMKGKRITFNELRELAGDVSKNPNGSKWHTALMVLKPEALKPEYRTPKELSIVIDPNNKVFGSYGGYSLFGRSIADIESGTPFIYRWEQDIGKVDYCIIID